MHSRRILVIHPRRKSGLAPIYLALLALVSLSGLGFAVAAWPQDPGPAEHRSDRSETLPASGPIDGVLPFPAVGRRTRYRA